MNVTGALPKKSLGHQITANPPSVLLGGETFDDRSDTPSVSPAEDHGFCPECGQILAGRASDPTWPEPARPWWAWGLVAIGATLTVVFGLSVLSAAWERAASAGILRILPVSENRIEGPSSLWAALQNEGWTEILNHYLAAELRLERARSEAGLGLATLILGISLLARRSMQRATAGRVRTTRTARPSTWVDSVFHPLIDGWGLAETIALSTFRRVAVTFLYLLVGRVGSGDPPTLDVLRETFDRVIEIVAKLSELVH
jgi:hypothetical protein